MKKVLSAAQMRALDEKTIEHYGVPSLVLMERAALAVCDEIMKNASADIKVGVFCGPGNNGGDGIAIARILHNRGVDVKAIMLGDTKKFSPQLRQELEIASKYELCVIYPWNMDDDSVLELSKLFFDRDVLVDAMFGIGLTRGLAQGYEAAAQYMNQSGKKIVAVDIPSGYDTDSGKLLGETAVKADVTVTFSYIKKGLLLGECKVNSGKIIVADVGIYGAKNDEVPALLDESILELIPDRKPNANKGTCGKLLIVAGSESIYGACYLAAHGALATGSGLVKLFTHENNIGTIQHYLPEAMYRSYTDFDGEGLKADLNWADAVVLGPGLGTLDVSTRIVRCVCENAQVPVVIDADGLNIIAQNLMWLDELSTRVTVIITPHLREMERLCRLPIPQINYNMEQVAYDFAKDHNCTVVLKNYTEIICNVNTIYYCCSGNEALATGGTGDVLAGIIGALLGQKMYGVDAAAAGAYLHGAAGTIAAKEVGIKSLLARDVIANIHHLI